MLFSVIHLFLTVRVVTVTQDLKKYSWELCKLHNITWDEFMFTYVWNISFFFFLLYTIDIKKKDFLCCLSISSLVVPLHMVSGYIMCYVCIRDKTEKSYFPVVLYIVLHFYF